MSKVKELKAKILEAQKNADIAAMYILQEEAHETFDEENLSGFFANILDLALENLTNTLESCSKLNVNDVQDFATLRALYEYAMEHYHAGASKDASALYEVLAGITDDAEFSLSLKYHYIAAEKGISLEDFMDEYADMQMTQANKTFYISCFKKRAQSLLDIKKSTAE